MLPQTIADVLARWNLPSDRLTLEITESIVLSDADRALGLLADLRRLGVRLSLDDFGTGYWSLTHLSQLPIQQLKIDRSFVMQVHDSPRDRAVIAAVAGLARNLDLEVVAEGIEKPETATLLADIGCATGRATTSPRRWRPSCYRYGSPPAIRPGLLLRLRSRAARRGPSSCGRCTDPAYGLLGPSGLGAVEAQERPGRGRAALPLVARARRT